MNTAQAEVTSDYKNSLGVTYEVACAVGQRLKLAREAFGYSQGMLAKKIKIREHYIGAIEEGEWDILPPGLNGRGLVRLCAKELSVALPEFNEFNKLPIAKDSTQDLQPSQNSVPSKKQRYQPAAENHFEVIKRYSRAEYEKNLKHQILHEKVSPSVDPYPYATDVAASAPHFEYVDPRRVLNATAIVTPKVSDVLGIHLSTLNSPGQIPELKEQENFEIEGTQAKSDELIEEDAFDFSTKLDEEEISSQVVSFEMAPVVGVPEIDDEEEKKQDLALDKTDLEPCSKDIISCLEDRALTQESSMECHENIVQTNVNPLPELHRRVHKKVDLTPKSSFLGRSWKSFLKCSWIVDGYGKMIVISVVSCVGIAGAVWVGVRQSPLESEASVPESIPSVLKEEVSIAKKAVISLAHMKKTPETSLVLRTVSIDVKEPVWMDLVVDGKEVFSGDKTSGELEYTFKHKLELSVEDGSKIALSYGGWDHGDLGLPGRKRKIVLNAEDFQR